MIFKNVTYADLATLVELGYDFDARHLSEEQREYFILQGWRVSAHHNDSYTSSLELELKYIEGRLRIAVLPVKVLKVLEYIKERINKALDESYF